jgi:hypothetical protein
MNRTMEASDFRVRNYFMNDFGTVLQVCEVRMNHLEADNFNTQCRYKDEVFGIPLTEEWLLKFGFKKDEDIQKEWSYTLNISGGIVTLFHHNKTAGLIFIDLASGLVQYVHQLQNLYFALKGEELEIKS